MGAAHKIIDNKTLQRLVPFNALSPVHFNEVAQKTVVEEIRAGRVIFKEGDRDNQSIYLLDGEINLMAGNQVVGVIAAGTDASRHPIAQQQPRQVAARAKTNCSIARIDSSLLDIMLTWDQSAGYEVAEIDDDQDDDWMTRILQSQAFLKLPPSNIQRLLMSVESYPVRAGDVIIEQDGEGDYFYIIKSGRCMVTRRPSANAKEVKLAELADGDAFGEDALVSDAKRNATVTMMTDGVLMRLAKQDFVELLKEPLLNKLDYAGAAALLDKGAELLDVRLPGEFENVHIIASRNLPLSALRLEAQSLDHGKKYIICCDTGRRSASAAFVLSQRGFEVYVLDQGFTSVPPEQLEGEAARASATPLTETAATASVTALSPAEPLPPAELQALQAELTAAQQAQQQLARQYHDAQEELAQMREMAREQTLELEQALQAARAEGGSTQNELQRLRNDLNKLRADDKILRAEADRLATELATQSKQTQGLQQEIDSLSEERERLHKTLQARDRTEAEQAAELQALRDQLAALESAQSQVVSQAQQIERLQNEGRSLAEQLEQAQTQGAELAHAQAEIVELKQALAQAQQQQSTQQTDLETLQADLHAARQVQSEMQDLQATHSALQQALDAAQARVSALEDERATQQQTLVTAEQQLDQLRTELETSQQSASSWEDQYHALRAELTTVQHALEQAQGSQHSERNDLQAELNTLKQTLQQRQDEGAAELQTLNQAHAHLQTEYERVQAALAEGATEWQALAAQMEQWRSRGEAAEMALEQAQREHQQALQLADKQATERLRAQLRELEADLKGARAALAREQSERDNLLAASEQALRKQQAETLNELQTTQTQLMELRAQWDAAQTQIQALSEAQAEQASGQRQQADLEEELLKAQAALQESDSASQEIEARLAEMTDAAKTAQTALEAAQQTHAEAIAAAELRAQELESDLNSARAALAREQAQRDNVQQANQHELSVAQAEADAELARSQAELSDLRATLQQAEAARQALQDELTQARAQAETQQQQLTAELEQLRSVTTTDLQALQQQIESLQVELKTAHQVDSTGGSHVSADDDELARLRLLLDEAREEAALARVDAETWREQALNESAPSEQHDDEVDRLRVQLADTESRSAEVQQLHQAAQQEIEQLRAELALRSVDVPNHAPAGNDPEPARRSPLWLGLLAGLLVGSVGAGVGLWYSRASAPLPVAAPAPASAAAVPAPPPGQIPNPPPPAAVTPSNVNTSSPPTAPAAASVPSVAPSDKQKANPVGRSFRDDLGVYGQGPEMLEIAATSFSMGSGASSLDFDERPKHDVQLPRFAIGKYEVTFAEYDAFARATGRALSDDKGWGREQRPVINVSWDEAVEYTRWLSEQTGKRYRLPSEAEWEYAAGSNERSLYWWGNSLGEGRANCFNCGSEWDSKYTAPVGSFAANPLGLYDTAGNVAEWVQDCYHPSYEGAPSDGRAWVTRGCARRVLRGGGFNSPANTLRATKRDQQPPNIRSDSIGFRVVREN